MSDLSLFLLSFALNNKSGKITNNSMKCPKLLIIMGNEYIHAIGSIASNAAINFSMTISPLFLFCIEIIAICFDKLLHTFRLSGRSTDYRNILRESLSLVQKTKPLRIFTAAYHGSHSLNECKAINFPFHAQYVKIDSLLFFINMGYGG